MGPLILSEPTSDYLYNRNNNNDLSGILKRGNEIMYVHTLVTNRKCFVVAGLFQIVQCLLFAARVINKKGIF